VCPNHVLGEIARTLPGDPQALAAIDGLRNWQVREFGADLLREL
jgi:HRDC domain